MRDRFLQDLLASASVDRPRPGAKQRVLERFGFEARGPTLAPMLAGAVMVAAIGLVFGGVRAGSVAGTGAVSAMPPWSVSAGASATSACAEALEAPRGHCDEGTAVKVGAGSSSGGTALGSSGG
jgi:hypothetical protein